MNFYKASLISTVYIILLVSNAFARQITENVILVTVDGLRWQELFMGADPDIIKNKRYVNSIVNTMNSFWNNDEHLRRQKLFPFIWSSLVGNGQIYGNRNWGNKVNLTNRYLFSYPGYNELLTGRRDRNIRGNARKFNKNETILEFANQQVDFKNKVAVFASWDVFHYIINPLRSGIHLNAGNDTAKLRLTAREKYLNHMQAGTPSPWKATRFDRFTHSYAKEYLEKNLPRLLLIAYGETDEFAHQGKYDKYLQAIQQADNYIKEIWEWIQASDHYRNKTTLIITTDHGRGAGNHSWKSHGIGRAGSNQTWFAIMGPDTKALGEIKTKNHYYTTQLANTIAAFLNLNYPETNSGGAPVYNAFAR
ncbi:alkaline phosphatase family protein [Pedobacter sp. P351]|uniref:alkaline phosphatase family protein n=1 Tax=Pedobacter superstes TaxID=3133441 RepID=UPI0030ABBEE2